MALRAILAAIVTEVPDQFLLLGVDRDHRLLFGQRRGHLGVDVAELRIPVGVTVALGGLAVGLQTVTRLIEQVGDQGAANRVTLRLQRLRQAAHALASPPQRRLRKAADRLSLRCCNGARPSAHNAFCKPSANATKLSPPSTT